MLDYMLILVYVGGAYAEFVLSRKKGEGIVSATIDSLAWPCLIGVSLVLAIKTAQDTLSNIELDKKDG